MHSTERKMLYISLRKEPESLYLVFEIEDYYRNPNRRVYTGQSFTALTKTEMAKDYDALDRLGFKVLIGLLLPRFHKSHYALALYSSALAAFRGNDKNSIDIDEELYRQNSQRIFCDEMPLNALDPDANKFDDVMCMRVAHKILKYLPLPE
jgi:hypothetical protein